MTKFLIVDDSAMQRTVIKKALTAGGFSDFHEARDGEEALTKFQELQPDFVTMDITMENMDGIEATKAIKKLKPNAKVLVISALGNQKKIIEAIQSGASDFVTKPYNDDFLLSKVNEILHQ